MRQNDPLFLNYRASTLRSLHETPLRHLAAAKAFQLALALHRAGRLIEAERLYRTTIQFDEGHFGATHNLGLLCNETGRCEEAIEWISMAILRERGSADAHGNLGTVLAALGRHEQAIDSYEKALALAPSDADTQINLGASLQALGRHVDAILHLQTALASKPDSAEGHNNLANALVSIERVEEAVTHYEAALRLTPDFAEAHNNLGRALMALDRRDEAIAHYEQALGIKPDYLDAHDNLACALVRADRESEAVVHFQAVLSKEPDRANTHNNLGQAFAKLRRHEEAARHFSKAVALQPDFLAARVNLGNALNFLERSEEALDQFAQALAIDAGCAGAYHGIGVTKQTLGLVSQARGAFERAVELAPGVPEHYQGLSDIKRFNAGDAHLGVMEDLARDMSPFSAEQQIALHFALGKAYGDIEDYERSSEHLLKGNALKRAKLPYDEAATLEMFSHTEKVFNAELLGRTKGLGDPSNVPIFIVGMPRSGTTLIEQVLASHSAVHGAGELGWIGDTARAFHGDNVRGYFPEVATSLTGAELRDLGAGYVEYLRTKSATAPHVTDKMPMNFRFIGLIRMMLPNAKIIHARRDPIDTCLSCFTKNFGGAIDYAFDLGELGRYWRAYDQLMHHWRHVLPDGAMHEVRYEELVADFPTQARRVIDYCGLEWEENCLAFYETQRPVRTASVNQVRRPLYQSSIARWRPYEKMLGPLLDALRR